MSSSSIKGSLAGIVFCILALLALVAALPAGNRPGWEEQQAALGEVERGMAEGSALHLPVPPPVLPEPAAFCGECHGLTPPHPGEGSGAAFLNSHASSFECLVCHWAKASGSQPDLTWDRSGGGEDGGSPGEGALVLRVAGPDNGSARNLKSFRDSIVSRQKCFDRGPGCTACHRSGEIGRYTRPGTSPQVEKSLERLPEFLTLPKGRKWYFPQRQ